MPTHCTKARGARRGPSHPCPQRRPSTLCPSTLCSPAPLPPGAWLCRRACHGRRLEGPSVVLPASSMRRPASEEREANGPAPVGCQPTPVLARGSAWTGGRPLDLRLFDSSRRPRSLGDLGILGPRPLGSRAPGLPDSQTPWLPVLPARLSLVRCASSGRAMRTTPMPCPRPQSAHGGGACPAPALTRSAFRSHG